MIAVTISIIIGMLAAFLGGFYCGYLKREGKPPEMPVIHMPVIGKAKAEPATKPTSEEKKANGFFN